MSVPHASIGHNERKTMLNTYASTTYMCAFCENLLGAEAKVCYTCNDYKGVMTIADFSRIYSEEM